MMNLTFFENIIHQKKYKIDKNNCLVFDLYIENYYIEFSIKQIDNPNPFSFLFNIHDGNLQEGSPSVSIRLLFEDLLIVKIIYDDHVNQIFDNRYSILENEIVNIESSILLHCKPFTSFLDALKSDNKNLSHFLLSMTSKNLCL